MTRCYCGHTPPLRIKSPAASLRIPHNCYACDLMLKRMYPNLDPLRSYTNSISHKPSHCFEFALTLLSWVQVTSAQMSLNNLDCHPTLLCMFTDHSSRVPRICFIGASRLMKSKPDAAFHMQWRCCPHAAVHNLRWCYTPTYTTHRRATFPTLVPWQCSNATLPTAQEVWSWRVVEVA
jgi:hypothetical protein